MLESVGAGPAFTSSIKYKNCAGYIDPAIAASFQLIYKPDSSIGLELKFSNLSNPTSYLKNDSTETVKIYTKSHITLQHLLGGVNYYLRMKGIHPYFGILLGASYAATKETTPPSSIYKFTWGLQTGTEIIISKSTGLRLTGSVTTTPGVANNTSYFNTSGDGSGFPGFIIGNPSSATISEWNIILGIFIKLNKRH